MTFHRRNPGKVFGDRKLEINRMAVDRKSQKFFMLTKVGKLMERYTKNIVIVIEWQNVFRSGLGSKNDSGKLGMKLGWIEKYFQMIFFQPFQQIFKFFSSHIIQFLFEFSFSHLELFQSKFSNSCA